MRQQAERGASGLRLDAAVFARRVSKKDIPERLHRELRVVSECLTAAEDILSATGFEAGERVEMPCFERSHALLDGQIRGHLPKLLRSYELAVEDDGESFGVRHIS